MNHTITLERGKQIQIKRLGLKGQAEVLNLIGNILDNNYFTVLMSDFSKIQEKNAVENLGYLNRFITSMCSNNLDDIFRLVCIVSDLTDDDLKVDGPESVHLVDVITILKQSWNVNQSDQVKQYFKQWFGDKAEGLRDMVQGNQGNEREVRSWQNA